MDDVLVLGTQSERLPHQAFYFGTGSEASSEPNFMFSYDPLSTFPYCFLTCQSLGELDEDIPKLLRSFSRLFTQIVAS